jgi:cysteine synthase/rhodanese-related sulfurtransferase|tara:strand:+ start:600 stop:1937 length:1338 start_codon:yes stop_codon:yes gene_type:complete
VNNHSLRVYDSILGLLCSIDNPTPLVRLNRVTPFQHTQLYAKLEWYNPFGAIKDRVAANMIADAQERGVTEEEQKLVEPTSGNTGLGLAMIANANRYSLTTPLSNQIPQEKRTLLRFFGTEVLELEDTLCPAPGAPEGAIAKAHEIAERADVMMLNQYANEANPSAHYKTTGPEVWSQTEGRVTHFVAGLGTCGTITGVGRYLKEKNTDIQVLGVHPNEGHDIPGVRSVRQLQQTRFFHPEEYDGLVEIGNQEAFDLCLRLNREESLTAGPSSAMALMGAFQLIPDEPDCLGVVIFPDSTFKYASSVVTHIAGLGSPQTGAKSSRELLLDEMIEHARFNSDLTTDIMEAHNLWENADPVVIDVRTIDEYQESHVPGAVNTPLLEMSKHLSNFPEDRDTPILTMCQRGNLSLSGVLFLNSIGYRKAKSVTGGLDAWREKGYATDPS